MQSNLRKIFLPVLGLLFLVSSSLAAVTLARAEEKSYFACFSNQNYAVRNANKMERTEEGFVLKNISLSSIIDFYVTDNAGSRWYASDDEPIRVDETAVYSYDILFSPEEIFEETGCHISYRFHEPAEYFLEIGGNTVRLSYNPYFTAYELYFVSSLRLSAGDTVVYGEEVHTVAENGFYRILFTPEKTANGSVYAFDENGNYGSGDGFIYSVYIEDAPQYYAVFGERSASPDAQINGRDAYLLTRYEKNVAAEEYRSAELFAPERDYGVRYEIYEQTAEGTFRLIDDDNNEDTAVSKLTCTDCGWYTLSFTDGTVYRTSLEWSDKEFGGWYAVGEFGYGFDAEGNIDLDEEYKFAEVEDGDDDYDEDYKQFILYITVTEKQLRGEDFEFYITDGETKFKDGLNYIKITLAGRYKILCSEEHDYGRGRRFRYVLEDESKEGVELNIGTAAEFNEFALKCSQSADYSVNLKVYLTADIDFAGVRFVPAGTFSGAFYGGYHKLKNITCTEGNVFGTVTHSATVERLTVENAVLGDKDAENVGFVGENYGTLKHITVSGRLTGKNYIGGIAAVNGASNTETGDSGDLINKAVIESCICRTEVYGESFAGGICGRNSGDIISCTATGKTVGSKTRASATASQTGGIAGYSFGKIYGCENTGTVEGDSYVGGIVGLCVGEVYFCFNRGDVSADKYTGGIIGYYGLRQTDNGIFGSTDNTNEPVGSNNILNYVINYGDVTANSYAGGVLGNAAALASGNAPARVLKIYNSASSGNVSVEAGSYAGGIAGSAAGVDIVSCISSGIIQAKGMNGGAYAGGIVGYGGSISYSASAATLKAVNYIGGIAGYATAYLTGCYTNVLILPAQDAENVGEIAGFAANFSAAQDSFTGIAGNYYTGEYGGICGREYAFEYGYAAARADGKLATDGTLSPELCEEFSREHWQGGNGGASYPVPRSFEEVAECAEFDDDGLFAKLFDERSEELKAVAENAARLTYTVTFMEWNKDNGDLYDDGVLQTDNFDIISAVRVSCGQTAEIPELKYAEANGRGLYVYEGGDARYYVAFPRSESVTENITVYAVYREIVTSVTDEENTVFAEGEFCSGTRVSVITVGEWRVLEFTLDGKIIAADGITVKYYVGDGAEKFTVYGADGGVIESTVSGKYLSFGYADGSYFTVKANSSVGIPFWGWLLIGIGSTAAVAAVSFAIYIIFKKRLQNRNKVL